MSNELIEYIELKTQKMVDVAKAKNQDYAGSGDPFKNFRMASTLGIASTEQALLTRMTDKFMRAINLINSQTQAVKDETIEDTLLDLANYSLILAAYLKLGVESKQINIRSDIAPEIKYSLRQSGDDGVYVEHTLKARPSSGWVFVNPKFERLKPPLEFDSPLDAIEYLKTHGFSISSVVSSND